MAQHNFLYEWASTRMDAGIEDSSLFVVPEWWHCLLKGIRDWKAWVSGPLDAESYTKIQECTLRDLPFGSEQFFKI
jgi:hypothetical protein